MASLSEHDEQAALVDWLEDKHPEVLFCSIPNGAHLAGDAKARARQSAKLKAEGELPGACDLILFEPRGGYHGCCVEMKTKTGRLSPDQEWFLAEVEKRGFYTIVGYGFSYARDMIEDYLSWPTHASTEGEIPY